MLLVGMLNQNYFFNTVNTFSFSFFKRRKAQYYCNSLSVHIILFDYSNRICKKTSQKPWIQIETLGQWLSKTSGSLIA